MNNKSLKLLEGLVLMLRSVKGVAYKPDFLSKSSILYDCCMETLDTLNYVLDNEVLEPEQHSDWDDEGPVT